MYIKDRINEFISFRDGSNRSSRPSNLNLDNSDTATLLNHSPNTRSALEDFFEMSRGIKSDMSRVQLSFDSLIKAHQATLRPTFEDASFQYSAVNDISQRISSDLQNIFNRINMLSLKNPNFPDRERIIDNIRQSHIDSYRNVFLQFQMTQQAFTASMNRSKKPTNSTAPSIDITTFNLGEDGNQREMELNQRHNNEEFEQISRRAAEIQQIFKNLATLVNEQGTLIDRIDYNISEALDNAKSAHENIVKAEKYQQKSRMWICAILLGIMVLIMVVLLILR